MFIAVRRLILNNPGIRIAKTPDKKDIILFKNTLPTYEKHNLEFFYVKSQAFREHELEISEDDINIILKTINEKFVSDELLYKTVFNGTPEDKLNILLNPALIYYTLFENNIHFLPMLIKLASVGRLTEPMQQAIGMMSNFKLDDNGNITAVYVGNGRISIIKNGEMQPCTEVSNVEISNHLKNGNFTDVSDISTIGSKYDYDTSIYPLIILNYDSSNCNTNIAKSDTSIAILNKNKNDKIEIGLTGISNPRITPILLALYIIELFGLFVFDISLIRKEKDGFKYIKGTKLFFNGIVPPILGTKKVEITRNNPAPFANMKNIIKMLNEILNAKSSPKVLEFAKDKTADPSINQKRTPKSEVMLLLLHHLINVYGEVGNNKIMKLNNLI